ncbi:response regulator [Paraglaciecola sp.]|uniref:response regulator n=1 Tax=Paraglaciecola sp. TaxID=1920173 RepID=UPI0030F3BA07
MLNDKIKVAVVEDNGLARANLRSHLLDMGFTDINCFSNGRELKSKIKIQKPDLLLIDYHLGQNKNGVEVIQELKTEGLIQHSTCIMFITSERLPLIIGQIVDMHPEALVIKPYTLNNLTKNIENSIKLHQYLMPVYELMDDNNYPQALVVSDLLLKQNENTRKTSSLIKLKARILTKLERYHEAGELYRGILKGSDQIIWAKWGLIQNLFLDQKIEESQLLLQELTESQLTSGKACEWLARICINNNQYNRAESYIQQIREGELSFSATRLKAYIYQAQERGQEAIHLLEKKRESNRSIRERFDEITLELARCYLIEAEEKPDNERAEDLQIAKFLIGSAGRKISDEQLMLKKDYMHALIAQLEGNTDKVREILARPGMDNLQNADIPTLFDAINAWRNIGDVNHAKSLLELSQNKLKNIDEGNEKTISAMLIMRSEEAIGERRPLALKLNKRGLERYAAQHLTQAIEDFYRAYTLFPREIAFSLNLLQSLVDAELNQYKDIISADFLGELQHRRLSAANKKRLDEIVKKMKRKPHIFSQHASN